MTFRGKNSVGLRIGMIALSIFADAKTYQRHLLSMPPAIMQVLYTVA